MGSPQSDPPWRFRRLNLWHNISGVICASVTMKAKSASKSKGQICFICRRGQTRKAGLCPFCVTCPAVMGIAALLSAFAAYNIGHDPGYTVSGVDPTKAFVLFLVMSILYFAPTLIAAYKNKLNVWVVAAVNVVLGLTGVGWIFLLVAMLWADSLSGLVKQPAKEVPCKYCLEPVLKGANICKHCKSDLGRVQAEPDSLNL
jgi:hypothetical protein